ncbi:polymeric immunoglobulin receptor-like [Amblyraja radiata]|uniref:polymeric immunoglobulin receptor-like n=1 Tax=Amblyraja radiata TaxID=386614 RepID=UPI001402AC72|nr:polymeric immunoglobulin receptor-like [Amblyraja radiata]
MDLSLSGTTMFYILLFLTVTSSSLAKFHLMVIRAGEGETVTIECPHAPKTGHVSWCKAYSRERCHIIVNTKNEEDSSGRISMRRINGSVFVTSQLQKIDTGTYWCGTIQAHEILASDIVMLDVFTADLRILNRTTVKGVKGNATTIHCRYKAQFKAYEKFLCKVVSVNSCSIIAVPHDYNSSKLSISADKVNNFAVTIRHTDEGDVGEYWCGARTPVDFEISQVQTVMFKGTITKPEAPSNKASGTPQIWHIILPLVLGLLIVIPIVLLVKKRKQSETIPRENGCKNSETPTTAKSEGETEDTIAYSTVTIQSSAQTEASPAIYSNIKDLKEQNEDVKIHSVESVEYSALVFRS